jgi:hypothetical protein
MMKSTGLGLLVFLMSVGGVAAAQDEETPATEAPPAGETPEATTAEEPAAETEVPVTPVQPPATTTAPPAATSPDAPAPAPGVSFTGAAAGADVPPPPSEALPPRVPWRGTSFEWINSATTSMIGVGDDYQSDSFHSYAMIWRATANYYLVDEDNYSITVRTQPTWFVELTDADDTNTYHEPQFLDLPLLASYRRNLYSAGLWSTALTLTQGALVPVSPASRENGTYIIPTHRLLLVQNVPLGGEDSPVFKSFTVNGRFRWDHRFSEATTGVNDDLDQPRTGKNPTGGSQLDDQLSGGAFSHDTLIEGIDVEFNEPVGPVVLSLTGGFVFSQQFKYDFAGNNCDITMNTSTSPDGCVDVPSGQNGEDAEDTFYTYGFNVGIGIQPLPEVSLSIDYSSSNSPLGQGQLGPDGRRRSVFYTPEAEFSATLTLYPDALYERIIGPPRAIAKDKRRDKKGAL